MIIDINIYAWRRARSRDEVRHDPANGQFMAGTGGSSNTPEHHASAARYKEYAGINEWLRGNRDPSSGSKAENIKLRDEMDAAIAANRLATPATLYRGFGDVDVRTLLTKSGTLTDKAFVSTSRKPAVATELGGGGYTAEIRVPAGANAYEFDKDDPQSEVVLPRRSKFKMMGIDHGKKTVLLHMTSSSEPADPIAIGHD